MREKVKLLSSAGTGHFYVAMEQAPAPGQDGSTQVRSGRAQARGVNQDRR